MSTFVVVKQCILQALLFLRQVHKILMSYFFVLRTLKNLSVLLSLLLFVSVSLIFLLFIYLFIYLFIGFLG